MNIKIYTKVKRTDNSLGSQAVNKIELSDKDFKIPVIDMLKK